MTKTMRLDLHNFARQYETAERHLKERTDLSEHNKALIFRYRDACLLHQVCGKVRLVRVMIILGQVAPLLGKNFETVTRADIEGLISRLMTNHAPSSMALYKSIIKRFFTFVSAPDQFPHATTPPAQVSWIRCHLRSVDQRRIQRTDLLTPNDIQSLLKIARNPRDHALIAILWETGGRVAEVGNEQLKHVNRVKHGYSLDFTGKTGQRNPLIISAAPALSQWLANHPFRDNPDAPLWVYNQYRTAPRQMMYPAIRMLLSRYFKRAGITKPFHPHIFRHSRATYMLAAGLMNESQAKNYFGWTPSSHMLATYSHLIDQDSNNAILRENGLTPEQQHQDILKPLQCAICGELNKPGTDYCTKCSAIINPAIAYDLQQREETKNHAFIEMLQYLVQRGDVDKAAQFVHDAGFADVLRAIAIREQNAPGTAACSPAQRGPRPDGSRHGTAPQ